MDPTQENLQNRENLQEFRLTSSDIRIFSDGLLQNTLASAEGKPLTEIYPDETQRKLAEGFMPTFQDAIVKKQEESRGLMPKEPLYRVIWALTSVKLSDAKLALDRYTGYSQATDKLHPLVDDESINISSDDAKDVGRIVGNLFGHHALADRPLDKIKPNCGDLEEERAQLLTASKDKFHLLDTIVDQLQRNAVAKKEAKAQ